MIDPKPEDIGRKVVYRDLAGLIIDEGVITKITELWVWVRYGDEQTAKATRRADLDWPR